MEVLWCLREEDGVIGMAKGDYEPLGLFDYIPALKWIFALIGVVFIISIFSPLVTINAGERGVVLKFGAYDRIMGEGLNFKMPVVENVMVMNVRTQKYEADASSASKDLQSVSAKIAVNYHITPESVGWLYQNVGNDYATVLMQPAIQESVKASTAQFTAEELITNRSVVREKMFQTFADKMEILSKGSIKVEEFNVVNFDFSEQFNNAIESKVTATQNALKAENDLKRIKTEAEQKVAQAKGEAEATLTKAVAEAQAIKITGDALRENPQLVQLEMVKKWNGVMPVFMTSGNGVLLNLDTSAILTNTSR
jgi:prohibitin 2